MAQVNSTHYMGFDSFLNKLDVDRETLAASILASERLTHLHNEKLGYEQAIDDIITRMQELIDRMGRIASKRDEIVAELAELQTE